MTTAVRTTRVAFLVNGDFQSPVGHRARSFAKRLSPEYSIVIHYRSRRKLASLFRFAFGLWRDKPRLVCVFDLSYSGVLAALLYRRAARCPVVVETGDAITELAKSMGRGRLGVWLTNLLEETATREADFIVVRGTRHRELLRENGIERVEVISDGVETSEVRPVPAETLRRELGLDDQLVIGFVGSVVWSERLRLCYGWELIELLRLLRDEPVKGIVIGDGSGLVKLKAKAREYGVEAKVLFLGAVPYEKVSHYLSAMDLCLSTQTNDVVGQVRTTGKLPLYLACGKFVLASRVGEAALVLPPEMLVDYEGVVDEEYPRKLCQRVLLVLANRQLLTKGAENVDRAKQYFDYSVLAERMQMVFDRLLGGHLE
jgi:glycosyltransferase involved in cell wall biosynthesis